MARRSRAPRRRVRKAPVRRRGRKATGNSVKGMVKDNHAMLSSTIDTINLNTNTMYKFNHTLSASSRAAAVAAQYQFYKLDYVEVRIKPWFDTYLDLSGAVGTAGAQLAPQLYFYKSLSDTSPTTIVQLKLMGVNPTPFAKDGNKVYRYKPALIIPSVDASGNVIGSVKKVSPWLACSTSPTTFVADATPHYGACFFIQQQPGAVSTGIASCEVETHFKFKAPTLQSAAGERVTEPVRLIV